MFRAVTGGPTTGIGNLNWVEFSGPEPGHPVGASGGAASSRRPRSIHTARGRATATWQSQRKLDRRTFIGAAAGAAGATALGPFGPLSLGRGKGKHKGKRLVPRDRLGLQQFAIRDSITRLDQSVTGLPRRPELPGGRGGHRARRRRCRAASRRSSSTWPPSATRASSSSVHPGRERPDHDTQQIRTALDNAGLQGRRHAHGRPPGHGRSRANRQAQIDIAGILGYRMVGTAGNPANPTLGTLAAWQGYAEQANTVGAAFRAAGIKYFFHPEQDWFRFFDDPAHPELARVHRIDWFTDNTDRKLVYFEPDTMHTLAGPGALPRPGRRAPVRRQRLVRAARRQATGSSPGTPRTPTASSRCPRRARTRSRRRARGRASRSTAASTSSTSARARSPRATRSTPTPR